MPTTGNYIGNVGGYQVNDLKTSDPELAHPFWRLFCACPRGRTGRHCEHYDEIQASQLDRRSTGGLPWAPGVQLYLTKKVSVVVELRQRNSSPLNHYYQVVDPDDRSIGLIAHGEMCRSWLRAMLLLHGEAFLLENHDSSYLTCIYEGHSGKSPAQVYASAPPERLHQMAPGLKQTLCLDALSYLYFSRCMICQEQHIDDEYAFAD